jgi:hypothetical protein
MILLQAAALLPVVALGRRALSVKRFQAALSPASPAGSGMVCDRASGLMEVLRVAWLVQTAADRGPLRANCLERSLVLWAVLRRRGIDCDLRIGARKQGERLEGHAWVEWDGVVLNDADDMNERFVVIPLPPVTPDKIRYDV